MARKESDVLIAKINLIINIIKIVKIVASLSDLYWIMEKYLINVEVVIYLIKRKEKIKKEMKMIGK